MNTAESAALALAAREQGWEETKNAEEAALVLLNTCSVRVTAEQRLMGRLAHYVGLRKKGSHFSLVVAGCMAERLGVKLKENGADFVMGTSERERFPLILKSVEKSSRGENVPAFIETDEKPEFSFSSIHHDHNDKSNPFRSFVPIMHGCNNYCSYCIVPYVRGAEVSRDPASVLEEIRVLSDRGVKEITLLGQNVNSYSWNGSPDFPGKLKFPGLLRLVAENLSSESQGIKWVRFLSSHPKDFSEESIRVLAENPCFCRHIHLPVQHGSNRILDAMNRRYTRELYLELAASLRSALPNLTLSTDILVGFPGETEEDLLETLSMMEEVKFLYAYMYHFNPREGTAAYDLSGRISREVKVQRLSRVIALQKRHTGELLKKRVGENVTVLIEGISRKNADELICRTEHDEMVVVGGKPELIGSFARLSISSLRGNTFRGSFI